MSFNLGPFKVDFMKPTFNRVMKDPLIRDPRMRENLMRGLIQLQQPRVGGVSTDSLFKMAERLRTPLHSSVFK